MVEFEGKRVFGLLIPNGIFLITETNDKELATFIETQLEFAALPTKK